MFIQSGEDLQIKQMKERDSRMKQLTEILSGMKVLKLYAWELPFMERINKIREKEISLLRTMVKLYVCCINFTFACSPFMVTIAVFGTFVLAYPSEILSAEKVKNPHGLFSYKIKLIIEEKVHLSIFV